MDRGARAGYGALGAGLPLKRTGIMHKGGMNSVWKYMREHETFLAAALDSGEEINYAQLRDYHRTRIEFAQHERLIHLLVTAAFALFFLLSVFFAVLVEKPGALLLSLLFLALLVPYIIYYYRLENSVQKWYIMYNQIEERLR